MALRIAAKTGKVKQAAAPASSSPHSRKRSFSNNSSAIEPTSSKRRSDAHKRRNGKPPPLAAAVVEDDAVSCVRTEEMVDKLLDHDDTECTDERASTTAMESQGQVGTHSCGRYNCAEIGSMNCEVI